MSYDFLVETYATERIKVLSVWSEFRDDDLPFRPHPDDSRGRSVREQMIHQCVSEDLWFRTMLAIDVAAPPLPPLESRIEFIKQYAQDSGKRLTELQRKENAVVGRGRQIFRRGEISRLDYDPALDSHLASPRATDGHAQDARQKSAQQLRANRRHRRLNAESCANHLCLRRPGGPAAK